MLDRLPLEIILNIAHYIDPNSRKRRPDYTFYYPSKQLKPLCQVNHYLQDAIAPLLFSHCSLVRKFEYEGPRSLNYDEALQASKLLLPFQNYIYEVEVPSSRPLNEIQDFKNIKSLVILGDNDIAFGTNLKVEHLSLVLPKDKFNVQGLKRLDLAIDPRLIDNMNALESFKYCPIQELNVTIRDLTTILKYKPFLLFILSLKSLNKLSLRCSNQPQPSSLHISTSDLYDTTAQFFQVLNKLSLTHLSIDFLLIRVHSFDFPTTVPQLNIAKPIHISIVEPSLAGPLTVQQSNSILSFLSCLSTYNIHTLNLVFGIQTELPYNTALHVLQTLCFEIHHGGDSGESERFKNLKSIKNVGALMAWNIIDDSIYMDYGVTKGLLSYESDGHFSPGYRKLETYEVNVSPNSLFLVRKGQQVDNDFWSRECMSTLLLKFSKYKRSSLWD